MKRTERGADVDAPSGGRLLLLLERLILLLQGQDLGAEEEDGGVVLHVQHLKLFVRKRRGK